MPKPGKYVEIELDKPRRLRYDYNAIADVEEKAGYGIPAIFNKDRVGFHAFRLLLWGGLKWADGKLTVADAGKLINGFLKEGNTLEDLQEYLQNALEQSGLFAFEEAGEEDEEGNPEAGADK